IGQMIAMCEDLIAKGHAYAAEGHVLFSVESYKSYGALSGRSVDDMIAGARVEVAPYKKNPMDFVLWKPSNADQPGWESPWGLGRPGWHIECSVMSYELLGETFDIHGGGNDLQFPHHENEIAQSCCAHGENTFARYWMHNEMLQVEGKKMSKSLGNFFTVRDLLDQGYAGEVIRMVYLGTHYRRPMDWTDQKANEAAHTLRKWRGLTDGVDAGAISDAVVAALADDVNTAGAIAELHKLANAGNGPDLKASAQLLGLLEDHMGDWAKTADVDLSAYEKLLHDTRMAAMETKDFSAVDALKSQLSQAGLMVQMSKTGVTLEPTPDFDPSQLEGLLS
ncbi:MAG: cysteine--tRNA ligase, partial [Halocynthiibacter sp.]